MGVGTSLRVMLVDDSQQRLSVAGQAVTAEGHQVVAMIDTRTDLHAAVHRHEPSLLFINVETPEREILEPLRELNEERPRPVVLCTARSDLATTRRVLSAGVTAYVVAGLHSTSRIGALLELALARFEMQQMLRSELDRARLRLADQRDIERAKGLLMRRRGIDEAEAYRLLRRQAMDRKQRIGEIARTLLAAADLWESATG